MSSRTKLIWASSAVRSSSRGWSWGHVVVSAPVSRIGSALSWIWRSLDVVVHEVLWFDWGFLTLILAVNPISQIGCSGIRPWSRGNHSSKTLDRTPHFHFVQVFPLAHSLNESHRCHQKCYDPSRARRAERCFCNGRQVDQLERGIRLFIKHKESRGI